MKIAISSDETGEELKSQLISVLVGDGHEVTDEGEHDYPEAALYVATTIQRKEAERGVLVCGTGMGMAMAANKVFGVYAGSPRDVESAARLARSNNAQIITLGSETTHPEQAIAMVRAFLSAEFEDRPNARLMRTLEGAK
jgi:ribose 5-phosphate isomerase B